MRLNSGGRTRNVSKWKQFRFALVGAIASGVLVLSACGGEPAPTSTPVPTPTDTPAPMTVVEYAQAVCDPNDPPDNAPWREIVAKLNRDIARAESVTPPKQVRDFHLSGLASMKETLKAIDDLAPDVDAVTNPYELVTNEDFRLKAQVFQAAKRALDPEAAQTLRQYGCNVDPEG